ncbi:MAG TPA: ectonucleotide pyrophosphatase/phosphodiesterase [Bryobacteraceae bacterium]|nr:ectonucleotide pyrophosphatase/phosphodiesterase [Bryobacteraceae bacterium]
MSFITWILFGAGVAFGPAAAQTPARQRMVVLISLDGFPAYALEDPKLAAPTLRGLIKKGAMARRMSTVNPTVTWPNHTALITGVFPARHGVLANGSIVADGGAPRRKVEPWIEKDKMVRAVTLYDLAHRAGLTTAQVDWVAIHKAPTITWEFPEVPSVSGATEREMIARGVVSGPEIETFRKDLIVWRDQVWTDAAAHLIRTHKPNLLLFHLLTLDSTHHTYGPRSLAGAAAIAFLDRSVKQILDAIREAGLAEKSTVVIVSDHGFKQYTRQIQPAASLAAAGLADQIYVLPEGGSALVYCSKDQVAAARKLFESAEGVERVVGPEEYGAMGLGDPEKDPQTPVLVLLAKSGYSFGGGQTGGPVVMRASPGGAHGYIATDPDMDAIFIASGQGIRSGVVVDRVRNVDVAPTLAALLGVTMPAVDGRVLREILQ